MMTNPSEYFKFKPWPTTYFRSHIYESSQWRSNKNIKRAFLLIGIILSLNAIAEPKTYTLDKGIKARVISVFDCTPKFTGKGALGDDIFVYVWECENTTSNKYAIYKTSYTSRYDSNFATKNEAAEFFKKYLASKVAILSQNNRMDDIRYGILSTGYTSKESSYADYFVSYKWDGELRMQRQGRYIFHNGYIAEWSVTSLMESGVAANEFNYYVKYFKVIH